MNPPRLRLGRTFANLPIARKLRVMILATSSTVLLLACTSFVVYDQISFRHSMASDLQALAESVAANILGSVVFGERQQCEDVLSVLSVKRDIVRACLFKEGKVFATHPRNLGGELFPPGSGANGTRFENGALLAVQPVINPAQQTVGVLYIQSSLKQATTRLRAFTTVVAVILAGAVALVYLASAKLQRLISGPILGLANTARGVAEKKDYTLRATKAGQDEVGFLIDQFNEMLAQIQKHEHELESVNQQLSASEQKARAATQAKSEFLARMSHELRTPLTAIIGFSEMLLGTAEAEGRTEEAEDLARINDSAKHLLELINDILDLSKIEARKMELHLETFTVQTLVQDVIKTIEPLAKKKANRLEVDCSSEVGAMRADLVKVRQSLFNLLSNASKFTDHGIVRLQVARMTQPNGDRIVFRVSDSGIGMTPDQLGKLFHAFSQAERSTARKYGGTGLGLAITKHFCEMMGGSIRAESQMGSGSTFTVELPAEVTKARLEPSTVLEEKGLAARGNGHCILVIDDDPNVHRLIDMTLREVGCPLRFATSGQEGLRLAKLLRPVLVTLDVIMPDMDGWAVLSALKSDPELAAIPVVMLTIMGDKDLGFALGAAEYLVKPIDRGQLVETVRKYLSDPATNRVLIVEDDAALRDMLRRLLEAEQWTVAEAENGLVALEQIQASLPSVILLDLLMPVMDGFQLLAELHKTEAWGRIPVIVMTAKDLSEAERLRLVQDTEMVLEKSSYVRDELVREVRRLISAYRPA